MKQQLKQNLLIIIKDYMIPLCFEDESENRKELLKKGIDAIYKIIDLLPPDNNLIQENKLHLKTKKDYTKYDMYTLDNNNNYMLYSKKISKRNLLTKIFEYLICQHNYSINDFAAYLYYSFQHFGSSAIHLNYPTGIISPLSSHNFFLSFHL